MQLPKAVVATYRQRRLSCHLLQGNGGTDAFCIADKIMSTLASKPELEIVKVGFVPLSDSAPILMASEMGFDLRHGIRIKPVYKSSWSQIRDGLLNGELDAAHSLYGMVYGAHLGIGSRASDMAILMGLNQNAQGITFSRALLDTGVTDGATLAAAIQNGKSLNFGHTFATGTHAMWLYYWLAAHGINPIKDIGRDVMAPPKMAEAMKSGQLHGFCAGEPWHALVAHSKLGATIATSQSIWPDHPEKVLAASAAWVQTYPQTAHALIAAILETSRWLDEQSDTEKVARRLGASDAIGLNHEVIHARYCGYYVDGLGNSWHDAHPLKFFDGGSVSFPWQSDGAWFLTQFVRWGLLEQLPDCQQLVQQIHQYELYSKAAQSVGVTVPTTFNRSSVLMDGIVWDGSDPQQYTNQFSIRAHAHIT